MRIKFAMLILSSYWQSKEREVEVEEGLLRLALHSGVADTDNNFYFGLSLCLPSIPFFLSFSRRLCNQVIYSLTHAFIRIPHYYWLRSRVKWNESCSSRNDERDQGKIARLGVGVECVEILGVGGDFWEFGRRTNKLNLCSENISEWKFERVLAQKIGRISCKKNVYVHTLYRIMCNKCSPVWKFERILCKNLAWCFCRKILHRVNYALIMHKWITW